MNDSENAAPGPRRPWAILLVCLGLFVTPGFTARAQDPSDVFEREKGNLFVVESYDLTSNNKNSVGSGFAVSSEDDDGIIIATNYHVVSDAVVKPQEYAIRLVPTDGETLETEILSADPIHDLAILRLKSTADPSLPTEALSGLKLASEKPAMGDDVFALGNPLDVGISVVPGVYNGELEKHFRPLIHFTGALNPGMSGGPAVNRDGQVIGINVAGAGNSVGFLIPVERLRTLIREAGDTPLPLSDARTLFAEKLREHNGQIIDDLVSGDWSLEAFGPLQVPKEIRSYVNCRGSAMTTEEDKPWSRSLSDCRVEDRLYLGRRFDTGPLEIQFILIESEQLNEVQFADLFSRETFRPLNRGGRDQFTDFECLERWTTLPNLGSQRFKASYCVRAYLDYPDIYDVLYVARSVPRARLGLNIHYTLAGVGRDSATNFHRKFVEAPQWN